MVTHIKFHPYHGRTDKASVSPVPTTETDLLSVEGKFLREATQLALYIDFVLGSLSQVVLKVYFSDDDGTTWFLVPGVDEDLTFLANAKIVYALPVYPTTRMKITVQGTGTNTGSSIAVRVMNKTN